jgi:hypothetical protein
MSGRAWLWMLTAGLAVAASPAAADPRLDEVVYTPYVENHVLELENRWGGEVGPGELHGAQTLVEELEAGLNDRVSLAVLGVVQSAPGEPERLGVVGLESVIYAGQIPGAGVDVAGYLEYEKGVGDENDAGEAKILLAKTVDRFQGLFNFIVERPFGAPSGEEFATYGYAASATWRTRGNLRLGAEAFGDLGDDHGFLKRPQGAYVGPEVRWEGKPSFLPVEVGVDAGWLFGVGPDRNEAPSQLRAAIEFEHPF